MAESGYGRTWALEDDGDLKFTELNSPEYIGGARAVVQDMKATLATPQGEDPFDPEHGLDMFTVTGGTDEQLKFEISEALTRDFEDVIQRIENIAVENQGSRVRSVTIDITLVDDERYSFGVIV